MLIPEMLKDLFGDTITKSLKDANIEVQTPLSVLFALHTMRGTDLVRPATR